MNEISVDIVCDEGAELPRYSRAGDAGLDLRSIEDVDLEPFERRAIHTGIRLSIPAGHAAFILPRSGMALNQGVGIVNSPGLIDSNYRGEILIPAINLNADRAVSISKGQRIAQLVVLPVPSVSFNEVEALGSTERGSSGFGSSGTD